MSFMSLAAVPLLTLAACGGDSGSGDNAGPDAGLDLDAATSPNTLRIVTPDVVIEPGQEITYCYYFDMPNTEAVAIKRWASTMSQGSHHLILYFSDQAAQPAGTLGACGGQAISCDCPYDG